MAMKKAKATDKALTKAKILEVMAEETGLIVPIGEWVIRTACAQNRAWQKAGYPPVRMAINLSSRQLNSWTDTCGYPLPVIRKAHLH